MGKDLIVSMSFNQDEGVRQRSTCGLASPGVCAGTGVCACTGSAAEPDDVLGVCRCASAGVYDVVVDMCVDVWVLDT
jgi:hypothetical protein